MIFEIGKEVGRWSFIHALLLQAFRIFIGGRRHFAGQALVFKQVVLAHLAFVQPAGKDAEV
jgi:hypothetical protein